MTYLVTVVVISFITLLIAFFIGKGILKKDAGNEEMKEISTNISNGAMAFLNREYRYLAFFIALVAIIIFIFLTWKTAVSFVVGAVFSIVAGYAGMRIGVKANVRTAEGARKSQKEALSVAFSGGAVMGLAVVGLGTLGLGVLAMVFGLDKLGIENITGFGLGASSIALFARVGGGIYTKAADVGADIVGKVEVGIPEDDPRNPAVIADNVGDNVGDIAGMGADLFESYVGSIISAITLGSLLTNVSGRDGAIYPMILSGLGIIASIVILQEWEQIFLNHMLVQLFQLLLLE